MLFFLCSNVIQAFFSMCSFFCSCILFAFPETLVCYITRSPVDCKTKYNAIPLELRAITSLNRTAGPLIIMTWCFRYLVVMATWLWRMNRYREECFFVYVLSCQHIGVKDVKCLWELSEMWNASICSYYSTTSIPLTIFSQVRPYFPFFSILPILVPCYTSEGLYELRYVRASVRSSVRQ